MDCINEIVGISKNGCDCLDIEAADSLSGLFLDDLTEGRIPLTETFFDCSDSDITSFLGRVIVDAKNETLERLSLALEEYFIKRGDDAVFDIPAKKNNHSGALASANYYVSTIRPKMPNLSIRFAALSVNLLSGSFSGNIKIIQDGNTLHDNTPANLVNKVIPLNGDTHFVYQSVNPPANHKVRCCSTRYRSDALFEIGGGGFDAEEDIEFKSSDYLYGIFYKGLVKCDPYSFLCDFDFTSGWGLVFAKTVQLIARRNLCAYILDSGKVTTYTTTNQERITDLMLWLEGQINDRLKFMPTKYTYSDCYCNARHIQSQIIV